MNILYVYQGDWPQAATRVAKQTESLVGAGYDVHLISRNYKGAPRRERDGEMWVNRLPHFRWRLLNKLVNFPFFLHPVWLWNIWKTCRKTRPAGIVASDLPMAPASIMIGALLKIPVHYDMAEVYPEFVASLWDVAEMSWSDRIVRNPAAARAVERWTLRRAHSVIVVSEESRDRCIRLGVAPERVWLAGNTPANLQDFLTPQPFPADLQPWKGRPIILFIGILIEDRGVKEAVEAMREVIDQVPDACFIVVGDGKDRPRIQQTIDTLGLADHVALLGWRTHDQLAAYYQHANIGLLPFLDTGHIRVTLANKLFDYMAARLAVVAVDVPPMRRILDETEAGVLTPPGNAHAMARTLVALLKDTQRQHAFGQAGRKAVMEKYCWNIDQHEFLRAVGVSTNGLGPSVDASAVTTK